MQSFMQSFFDLSKTSYWHPLIWCLAAGFVLHRMPRKTENIGGKNVERWHWFTALLLVLPFILWAGFRTHFFDTVIYAENYNNMPSSAADISDYLANNEKDKGFSVLMILCRSIGMVDHQTFFMLIAVFQMICLVYTFRKYTKDFWIAFFLFVASTDYLSWMHNGVRQFIAVSMIFAAFGLLVRKRYVPYVFIVLLASTIHGSALLMLPFAYVMRGSPLNRKSILVVCAAMLAIPVMDRILPIMQEMLMDTQYHDVMTNGIWENDDGTNLIRVLVYSVPALTAFLGFRYIRDEKDPVFCMGVNAALITMATYLISAVTSGIYIGRIPIYTTLYGYMVLPDMVDRIFEETSAKLIKMMMVVCYVAFYIYQTRYVWQLFSI